MTSPLAEAIEGYAEVGKLLVQKWREYGSAVATDLESGYKAEDASAYLGTGVSLTIETWSLLMWKTLDAIEILTTGDPDRYAWSKELSTEHKGVTLQMQGDLEAGLGRRIRADRATFDPKELGSEENRFRVCVDVKGCRTGIYDGKVLASTPAGPPEVLAFRIRVPPVKEQ